MTNEFNENIKENTVLAHPLLELFKANGFKPSFEIETIEFPIQNSRERDILETKTKFWVVIGDKRSSFANCLRVEVFSPYRWMGDTGNGVETGYGWVDEGGNTVSNEHLCVNPYDDYQVVLFKAIDLHKQ